MHKIILTIIVLLFPVGLQAKDQIDLNTIRSVNHETKKHNKIPINLKSELVQIQEIWRSSEGINCSATILKQKKGLPKGTFECITAEGYKAQIDVDCSIHTSQENSAYLFFGLVGKAENTGNFYLWCEKNGTASQIP